MVMQFGEQLNLLMTYMKTNIALVRIQTIFILLVIVLKLCTLVHKNISLEHQQYDNLECLHFGEKVQSALNPLKYFITIMMIQSSTILVGKCLKSTKILHQQYDGQVSILFCWKSVPNLLECDFCSMITQIANLLIGGKKPQIL